MSKYVHTTTEKIVIENMSGKEFIGVSRLVNVPVYPVLLQASK